MTPCRLSACSMLSSVEATLVGGLLPLFSQYRTDRGWHPAARARSACVSPASIRAARISRPETMLLITRLYIRFWKSRHGSPALSKAGPDIRYQMVHAVCRASNVGAVLPPSNEYLPAVKAMGAGGRQPRIPKK